MITQLHRAITEEAQNKCFAIRRKVFIEMQGISETDEYDRFELESDHYILESNENPIGTARIRYIDDRARIERVAILPEFQKKGFGALLMQYLLNEIAKLEVIKIVELGAQTHAIGFYERLGFCAYGDEYINAGIPHKEMYRENYEKIS